MKKSIYRRYGTILPAALALLAVTAGCGDYNPSESLGLNGEESTTIKFADKYYFITAYSPDFIFPFEGGEANTYFFSTEAWSLRPWDENKDKGLPEWLSFNATSGSGSTEEQELILTAQENTLPEARTAILALTSGQDDLLTGATIVVSQNGSMPYVHLADGAADTYSMPREGGTVTVAIQTNVDPATGLTVTAAIPSWVEFSDIQADHITIGVAANTSTSPRTNTVTVRCTNRPESSTSFTINQAGASFGINEETVQNIPVTGGTLTVNLTSQSAWRATVPAECQSWVSVNPASGSAGTSQITIAVAPNNSNSQRTGYVNIYPEGQPESGLAVELNQGGQQIEASQTSLNFNSGSSNQIIEISSNVNWAVTSKPGWITVTPTDCAAGRVNVELHAAANPSAVSRSADVVFSVSGSQAPALTIHCNQNGKNQDYPDDAILFGWSGGSRTVSINAGGTWQTAQSADWINLSATSGSGNSQLTISVGANTGNDYRQGTVYIYDGASSAPTELTIVQENQYLIIDNTSGVVGAQGGTIRLDVYSSVGSKAEIWTSESNQSAPSWISSDLVNSGTDHYYRLTIQTNPSGNERTALFVITPDQQGVMESVSRGVKYSVTQQGRHLSASVSEISLLSAGGQTPVYTVTADGNYEISKASADTWYILTSNNLNNTFYIIATPNNSDNTRRGTITIRLLDTPQDGGKSITIPVVQFPEGTNFLPGNFSEEEDWNL